MHLSYYSFIIFDLSCGAEMGVCLPVDAGAMSAIKMAYERCLQIKRMVFDAASRFERRQPASVALSVGFDDGDETEVGHLWAMIFTKSTMKKVSSLPHARRGGR